MTILDLISRVRLASFVIVLHIWLKYSTFSCSFCSIILEMAQNIVLLHLKIPPLEKKIIYYPLSSSCLLPRQSTVIFLEKAVGKLVS
jgi:hypothetical protein